MPRPNLGPKLVWNARRDRYYIRWCEKGVKVEKSTKHRNILKARLVFDDFLKSYGNLDDNILPHELSVESLLAYYFAQHAPTCASPDRIRYCINALLPFWSERKVSEINRANCRAYGDYRNEARPEGVKASTIRRELGTLVAALNFSVRDGKLTHAPYVPLPEKSEPKERWLTVQEAARLVREARKGGGNSRSYLPLFILLGLYTGARSEALLSLTWDRVDLIRQRIDFQIPGRKRTKKRRPTVPIPRQLMTFLRLAYAKRPEQFEQCSDGGPVIHDDGAPLIKINRSLKAAARRGGMDDVTAHTLRHTCGTWMAQQGTPLWHISGWLGQDVETTERIYAHHHPDYMDVAKRGVERSKRTQRW